MLDKVGGTSECLKLGGHIGSAQKRELTIIEKIVLLRSSACALTIVINIIGLHE